MSGTDGRNSAEPLPGPAFILVEPQMGENIGASARAMWNFGFADMRVVAPRDGWPNERAVAMASGATRVLDAARIFERTADASAEMAYVYATTARPRELTKRVITPAAAAVDAWARIAMGQKVGVLFGRERTGLENEDVVAANAIVTVPANPSFASLNLAQCVLLMGYELRRAYFERPDLDVETKAPAPAEEAYETGGWPLATREAVDGLFEHFVEQLDEANYFWPEHKRAAMETSLRNLLSRTPFTDQDARMMRGVVRALAQKGRRKSEPGSGSDAE